jgi:hypothetical protein
MASAHRKRGYRLSRPREIFVKVNIRSPCKSEAQRLEKRIIILLDTIPGNGMADNR